MNETYVVFHIQFSIPLNRLITTDWPSDDFITFPPSDDDVTEISTCLEWLRFGFWVRTGHA